MGRDDDKTEDKMTLDRATFDRLAAAGLAGTGRPMLPDAPGFWWVVRGPAGDDLAFGDVR